MPRTIHFFRDTLIIDHRLRAHFGTRPDDTLVLAGREVILIAFPANCNFVIAADRLNVPADARTIIGVPGNPSPSLTILARRIDGAALAFTAEGMPGEDGEDGEPGVDGGIEEGEDGKPIPLPGLNGGHGGDGGNGGNGGRITIRYASAAQVPTGSVPGGRGGRGGKGGSGGSGRPRGKRGMNGLSGSAGGPGTVDIAQVETNDVWALLDAESARQWAAYRAEVAGFSFRKFDPESQLFALEEARTALTIHPADAEAIAVRDRIANRQIPSGLARDLDIAPDFLGLSVNLAADLGLVNDAFQAYLGVTELVTIADSIQTQLGLMGQQLAHRKTEAENDVRIAGLDVLIARREISNVELQIGEINDRIEALRERQFGIGGLVSTVGSLAGAIMSMGTGVGAVISLKAGLVSLNRIREGEHMDLVRFFKLLGTEPDPNSQLSEDFQTIKKLGGGMRDLIEGTDTLISFPKLLSDIALGNDPSGQGEIGRLLEQQVLLVRQKMVGQLRETQARSRVVAAELRVTNLRFEIRAVERALDKWNDDEETLTAATELLIRAGRRLVDKVMEDVFVAQRAREIYQLDGIGGLRFDFGYLHPDDDRDLTPAPARRASACLLSLSGLAVQVLAWDQLFRQLNTAQIGFDVVHPQLSVTIADAVRLQEFAGGSALDFSIDLADVPAQTFEPKVNALRLELAGASSEQSGNIRIVHSGRWSMNRRTDGSVTEFLMLPRSELFACSRGSGTLTAKIPANPQSSAEPGPPFSFWGRGVATTFRLQVAQPSVIDVSQLSAIHLTIDCIGYAPQGAP